MTDRIRILGIVGSMRKESYNRALAEAAAKLVPEGSALEITGIEGIPLFNQDDESHMPQAVVDFKRKIREADAIVFFTPEYNYSIPGALKNAIDYASRPYGDNSFEGKAVAIASASVGKLGGARAQYQLRQVFVFLDMVPVNRPELFVTFAPQKFDEKLQLKDESTKKTLAALLENLVQLARKVRKEEAAVPA